MPKPAAATRRTEEGVVYVNEAPIRVQALGGAAKFVEHMLMTACREAAAITLAAAGRRRLPPRH